jgi:gamma-glutamylcyclotransferase
MEVWYFAYGSNLLADQMIERTGAIGHAEHPPRIARLAGYRLVFQALEERGPAFANIRGSDDEVHGVVYRCSPAHLSTLDVYESGYERLVISVSDQHGEVLEAVAYIVSPAQPARFGRPSEEYLERIVTGARQHGLPEPYIGSVVVIARAGSVEGML